MRRLFVAIYISLLIAIPSAVLATPGSTTWYVPFFNDDDTMPTDSTAYFAHRHHTQVYNPNDTTATLTVTYYNDITGLPLQASPTTLTISAHQTLEWRPSDHVIPQPDNFYGNYIVTSDLPVIVNARDELIAGSDLKGKAGTELADKNVFHKYENMDSCNVPPQIVPATSANGRNHLFVEKFSHTHTGSTWSDGESETGLILYNPDGANVANVKLTFRRNDGTVYVITNNTPNNLCITPHGNFICKPSWFGWDVSGEGSIEVEVLSGSVMGYYTIKTYSSGPNKNFSSFSYETGSLDKEGVDR